MAAAPLRAEAARDQELDHALVVGYERARAAAFEDACERALKLVPHDAACCVPAERMEQDQLVHPAEQLRGEVLASFGQRRRLGNWAGVTRLIGGGPAGGKADGPPRKPV